MSPSEKHTPGPWRWEDRYDSGDCLEHKKLGLAADCENIREGRIVLLGSHGETVLAAWADWAGDQGLTVSREDARLIAEAPDLLEALEMWKCPSCGGTKRYSGFSKDAPEGQECRKCKDSDGLHPVAFAAIRKAKGE